MLGSQILCVYEVHADAFVGKLDFIFKVANRIADRGVVMDRILLYRHGAEIPTDWGGQHYRLKMDTWGDPNVVGQLWFTVRTDHEEQDELWWLEALSGGTGADRSLEAGQGQTDVTVNISPEA